MDEKKPVRTVRKPFSYTERLFLFVCIFVKGVGCCGYACSNVSVVELLSTGEIRLFGKNFRVRCKIYCFLWFAELKFVYICQ